MVLCLSFLCSAASDLYAFTGYPVTLLCGVMGRHMADWAYQELENGTDQKIAEKGALIHDHSGRLTVDGRGLTITVVRASDAGIYICGHASQLFHKVQLIISGL